MNNTGGNESENFDILLDDIKLERVNNTNFLEVIIDENLTWKNHIDGITNTISRNTVMMNKLKGCRMGCLIRFLFSMWHY